MKDPRRDARTWLAEAEEDLDVARVLERDHPARACFHTEQAAEKALKAVLYGAGERPVIMHSLRDLGLAVQRHVPDYADLHHEVVKLDRYYVAARYPNGLPEGGMPSEAFDREDAASAIGTATKAVAFARDFVMERFEDEP